MMMRRMTDDDDDDQTDRIGRGASGELRAVMTMIARLARRQCNAAAGAVGQQKGSSEAQTDGYGWWVVDDDR